MTLKDKKFRLGKHVISLMLAMILIVMIGTSVVVATAYVVLQWTNTATVVANPKVCFIKWADGSKVNTFPYTVNIFPSIKTVDENITYGLWNWDTSAHNVYFRLASENTNSTDVAWCYYKVYNGGGTLFSKNESSFDSPDTNWSTAYSAALSTKYTIWMEIKAGASAGVGHTPTMTFEMKVENP